MPKGIRLGGRQKGTPNKATAEIRQLALKLFTKDYWQRTEQRLLTGECNPKIEALLLTYAYGAPKYDDPANRGVTVNIGFLGQPPTQLPAIEVTALPSAEPESLELTPRATLELSPRADGDDPG